MILAVLQARFSSQRLPGKVLNPLLGKPMIERQIERLRRSQTIDELVLATSVEVNDKPIADLAATIGVSCFRGSLDDVLDRFYQAARPKNPRYVVRLTGDCPLADWSVIDRVVEHMLDGGYDYASNVLPPTWPDGLDVEIMTFDALETAWRETENPFDREHVTPFIHGNPDRFSIGNLAQAVDQSDFRWTVDNPEDFSFVSRVYEALYPANPAFTSQDIFELMRTDPTLRNLNAHIGRNEGSQTEEFS